MAHLRHYNGCMRYPQVAKEAGIRCTKSIGETEKNEE